MSLVGKGATPWCVPDGEAWDMLVSFIKSFFSLLFSSIKSLAALLLIFLFSPGLVAA